jgi:hypothetical protein
VLATILRTDAAVHRTLAADSELAQAIAVLARAQQDAVRDRSCAHNKLRTPLREYNHCAAGRIDDKRGRSAATRGDSSPRCRAYAARGSEIEHDRAAAAAQKGRTTTGVRR